MSGNSNDRWRRCDKLFAADGKLVSTYTFNPSYFGRFYARWRNCEKRLLASSCLSVRPSIRPHGTRLPMGGFSWNLIFAYFSKICREISSWIKIWQEQRVLYMKTIFDHTRSFLLRMRNISNKRCRDKIHILCSIAFSFPIIFYCIW